MFFAPTKSRQLGKHPIRKGMVQIAISRRARQAGIDAFTLEDLHRTHMLLCCGQWRGRCCCIYPPGREIIPVSVSSGPSLPAPSRNGWTSSINNTNRIIFRYLYSLGRADRPRALAVLDRLARLLNPDSGIHTFPWARLSIGEIPPFRTLRATFAGRDLTIAKRALNGVLREACLVGAMDEKKAWKIQRQPWTDPHLRPSSPLSLEGLMKLLAECRKENSAKAARDGALIALLWEKQLGVTEAIKLPVASDRDTMWGMVVNESTLPDIANSLARWLGFRGFVPGAFLLSVTKGGKLTQRPMTKWSVVRALQRRCSGAGLPPITPDQVRIAGIRSEIRR
jgi:hypothetical protein